MCDKPIAGELWRYESVRDHWDKLILRSWAVSSGKRELYQEGAVSAMLSPEDLMSRHPLSDGGAMFGGTLPAIGGVHPAERFEFELHDPIAIRTIRHGYNVHVLPVL